MSVFKIIFGVSALLLAWALFFRAQIIYTINRWMREYAFSDQWVLFSGRRMALLFLILGGLALFSGIDHVMDQSQISPEMFEKTFTQAQVEYQQADYEHALNRCKILLKSEPGNIKVRELVAACLFKSGDVERGDKEVALIQKISPDYNVNNGFLKDVYKLAHKK